MPPPAEPMPLTARALLAGVAGEVGERAGAVAETLRRTDRFTRMRAAIVAAWAVLSAATVWGACGAPGHRDPLGAEVRVVRESIMGVQLMVRNDSDRVWEDVVLTVDGRWTHRQATLRPGDQVVIALSAFRDGDGPPPADHQPRALAVACRDGTSRVELR